MERVEIGVEGMTCASCVRRVENHLKSGDGVANANVNLATESATISFDPELVDYEKLKALVAQAGYKPFDLTPEPGEDILERRRAELKNSLRRFALSALLSLPVMALSISAMFGAGEMESGPVGKLVLFIFTTLVLFWPGMLFMTGAWKSFKLRSADMNTLIAVGTLAAYCYSTVSAFIPAIVATGENKPPVYFETAVMIVTLILMGKYMEARAKGKASEAMSKLMNIRPKTARVVRDGVEVELDVEKVMAGDMVIVRPGESIPVDGPVVEGASSVDESME